MFNARTASTVALTSIALSVAGCASPELYQKRAEQTVAGQLPDSWGTGAASDASAAVRSDWWAVFNDPALVALVEEAQKSNFDLVRAVARVDESRAALAIANADRWPAVYGDFGVTRSRTSALQLQRQGNRPAISDFYTTGLNASYELDLWGKYAKASAAARADLLAVQANRDAVRLAVASQTAQSYFALRALDAQVAATTRILEQQRASLALQHKRFDLGAISEYELRQYEAEVASTEATLPSLQNQRSQAETALAVLVGRTAREVYTPNIARDALVADAVARGELKTVDAVPVPAGMPSELLLRRPDLRSSEQSLVATEAHIASARANYFPSIGLTGSIGAESLTLANLFKTGSFIWSLGASLTQPIWQGGRLFAQTDQAIARRDSAVADYREAVANAFKDVRDALVTQDRSRATFDAARAQVLALERARALVKLRYDNGTASQLDVIDAERQLLIATSTLINAERDQRNGVVALYKALGGGWQVADAQR